MFRPDAKRGRGLGAVLIGLAAVATLALHLRADASPLLSAVPSPTPGVVTEILALPTGPVQEGVPRPAFGNEPLMAAIFNPAAGENNYGPAIVFVDEGPGSHPAMASLASRFAAERLAAKGYTVISIFPEIDRGFGHTEFKAVDHDIKVAIDFLEARGHEDIVLAGHGLGATAVALYLATDNDELFDSEGVKRVKAAVLFAPPTDEILKEGGLDAPGRLNAKVAEARAIIANKRPPADIMDGKPGFAHADMVQSPEAFLTYWGPVAQTRLSDYLSKVSQPVLMLAGTLDALTPPGRLEQLKAIAIKSARVDSVWYPGANHAFDGVQGKATDDMAAWLKARGLGVPPRVKVELLDARLEDGSVYPATLYTPAAGVDLRKPAFLLQFGTSGDMWHSATQWLAWRLAQQGYAVLSPRSRMSGGIGLQRSNYEEQTADLQTWLNVMAAHGLKRVVLEGHSLGGVLVSNLAATQDPRVIGAIYMAPTRDSPTHARDGQGEAHYAKVVAEAKAAMAQGEDRDIAPSYATYPAWAKDSYPAGKGMVLSGGGGDTAFHFLDFRGPDAPIHTQVVRSIKVPALIFAATHDPLMTPEFIDSFTKAYGGRSEVVWYDGTHGARESKTLIRDRILDWVKRTYP